MPSLTDVRKFQELLNQPANDSPYLFDKIFDDSGFWARRRSKKKFKLLKNIDPTIRSMLKPGETVCFVTWGTEETTADTFLLGKIIKFINSRAFVLTTSRILLIQITPGHDIAALRSQIEYSGISKIDSTLLGNLIIIFNNASKATFSDMPKKDHEFLRQIIEALRKQIPAAGQENLSTKSDLCPHCYKIVDEMPEACPHCKGQFKSARQAVYLSFILPGLGYWYLGYKLISIIPMLIGAMLWLVLVINLTGRRRSSEIISSVITLAVIYIFTALTAHGIAKKGIYPGGGL